MMTKNPIRMTKIEMEKGAGVIRTLYLPIVLLYQFEHTVRTAFSTLFSPRIHGVSREIIEMGA
jgi:hypothetical protein